jgi:hypothetical protein
MVMNASTTTSSSRTVGAMLGAMFGVGAAVTSTSGQNFTIALSDNDGEFISRVIDARNQALTAGG